MAAARPPASSALPLLPPPPSPSPAVAVGDARAAPWVLLVSGGNGRGGCGGVARAVGGEWLRDGPRRVGPGQ